MYFKPARRPSFQEHQHSEIIVGEHDCRPGGILLKCTIDVGTLDGLKSSLVNLVSLAGLNDLPSLCNKIGRIRRRRVAAVL